MTTTSLNFREAAFAQETGRVPIALITLSHADLADDIRISTDPTQRLGDLSHTEQTAADWNAGELDGLEADGDDLVLSSAVVAAGSIAAGDNKLDYTSDNAFIEFGVDLTSYHGNHKIVVTDSAGKSAAGYLHSVAPGGETLGGQLLTNYDFSGTWGANDVPQGWELYGTVNVNNYLQKDDANNRLRFVSDGGYIGIKQTSLTVGTVCYLESDCESYAAGTVFFDLPVISSNLITSSGIQAAYRNIIINSINLQRLIGSSPDLTLNSLSVKRLTDCAATGALIVSTLGGSTRSWASVDTGFNPNLACTYEISAEGTRLSPPVDLTSVGTATGSTIEWTADVPENTTLTIYSGLSESDEEEPASWDECTSGESIPSVTLTDMAGKYLWIKQYMTTAEEGVSPSLSSISVGITGDYTTDSQLAYGTVSNGDVFIFLPVRIKLPDDTDEGPGEMQLEIDNVHRAYTETIRSVYTPVTCQVDIVMDNALDTIDASWPEFKLTNITYNATTITGTLKLETLETEPFPAGAFVPSYFPGLFG